MDKILIFAVAGSGKTTKILNSMDESRRSLVITYTNENLRSLESSLYDKYGCIPKHVSVRSYFSFLYGFCFRPYFSYDLRDNAYTWSIPPLYAAGEARYISKGRYIYGNRAAKYISAKGAMDKVRKRLERYFDCLFVDEVQDFASNDFDFLLELCKANVETLLVGDFHQHTFDTSRDGTTRKNLHKKGAPAYLKEFTNAGFLVDTSSLDKTLRCSPSVCRFIQDNVGIQIKSSRGDDTGVFVVDDQQEAIRLFEDGSKVKLFYENSKKYDGYTNNWGKSKGLNKYGDVCVVLNRKTAKLFKENRLGELPDSTRNKLYVACSRARGDLYILYEDHLRSFKGS